MEALYTLDEAAQQLRVSVRTVQRAVKAGRLPCRRLGTRTIRFTEDDLRAYVTPEKAEPQKPKNTGNAKTRRPVITRI